MTISEVVTKISGVPKHRPFKQIERILDLLAISGMVFLEILYWQSIAPPALLWLCVGWVLRLLIDGICFCGDSYLHDEKHHDPAPPCVELSDYINAAAISGDDVPHVVVAKLQAAINTATAASQHSH